MAEISIVVALFNKKKYIESCITSILNQSFNDFELIIIDDGSTDGSLEIAQKIKDSRIKLISQKNTGPGIARNKGIEIATAPFITFIDADDSWNSNFLKTALTKLKQHKECDLYICAADWQPLEKRRFPFLTGEQPKEDIWNVPVNLKAEDLFDIMNFFATGSVVAKTSVIRKYKGFFSKVKCTSGEDAYLWIQVMFNHTILRDPDSYLTINTEGSDLGIGRPELKPIPPALSYPATLFKNTPQNHQSSLKKLLDLLAFYSFRRELYQMKFKNAWRLWRKYPDLSNYRNSEYPSLPYAFLAIPAQKIFRKVKGKFMK